MNRREMIRMSLLGGAIGGSAVLVKKADALVHEKNEPRLKNFVITVEQMVTLLRTGEVKGLWEEFPKTAQFRGCAFEPSQQLWILTFEHPTFDPKPPYYMIENVAGHTDA